MGVYPKRRVVKAEYGLKFNLSNLTNGNGGLNSSLSGLAVAGSDALFGQTMKTDERGFQSARSTGNYMGRNAVKGAAMGAQYGVLGAAVGAGLGAIGGLFQSNKLKKQAENQNRVLTESNERNLRNQGNAIFHNNLSRMSNSLYKKGGCIYPGKKTRMFSAGGIILGGNSHKDMGNLIVDENDQPVAETESEELLLSQEQTEALNRMIELVEQQPDDLRFAELGKYFAEKILPDVTDNSGKFMLNKAV